MFAVTPDWNGYTGYVRLIETAWNLLVDTDPLDLQIKSLTKAARVSTALFHKYFPSLNAVLGEVAGAGLATLLVNLKDEESFEDFLGAWVRFANARPRHYALMFSPTVATNPKVTLRMDALGDTLRSRAEDRLGFTPGKPQIQTIFGIIHGAASLVAAGLPRQSNQCLVQPLDAYLSTLEP